ncbi:heme exporter protein CcmD [Deinococcus sp. SDU3-2]|uniref:Heme exporter protein D n=1 Tax=Deinococcus terrestris TaxID=2651870 RepID=A0A7X1NTG9_9DEIO|nr:heme exporter protein CcmD [Deinococcus terrestris]MPY65521.1 heme exporter protein CcmD [Deinococcus terrestris]
MDKYTGYVVVVYVVTFLLLVGYLAWMWWRLRQVRDEGERR